VTRIPAEPGISLTTETPILLLAQITNLEAQLYLPMEYYGKLKVGQSYPLAAAEPVDRTIQATLRNIDPIIDPASRTFRCVFAIPNTDESLPAGFSVRLLWE
jgi:multidrug efflux pump subunit AcrA (membrane-fusion protein)